MKFAPNSIEKLAAEKEMPPPMNIPVEVNKNGSIKKVTKLVISAAKNEKYYKQFDFFFKRSCFRTFTEFYKESFNKWYAKHLLQMKKDNLTEYRARIKMGLPNHSKQQIDSLLRLFIDQTFGSALLQNLNKNDQMKVINSMMMIVFSHRYSKGDRFIVEAEADASAEIDFSIVRDTMYKYSKKAQDNFLEHPIESFLFASFSLSDEGLHFLTSKPDN